MIYLAQNWYYCIPSSGNRQFNKVGQRHAPAALPSGKTPGTDPTGRKASPRAGLDGCGKSRPRTGVRISNCPARSESLRHARAQGIDSSL